MHRVGPSVPRFASSLALLALAASLAQAEVDPPASSSASASAVAGPELRSPTKSRSIGRSNRGWLRHAAALHENPTLHVRTPNHRYGTEELVALLEWAADEVAREHPGSVLTVGDLSRRRGGRLRPHRSHRSGLDADLGFYLREAETGEPAHVGRFVALGRDGKGTFRETGYGFDDARNWTLVAALMGQDTVPVQYIMVIAPLKERLLAEGRRRGAPEALLHRVEEAVGPRRTGRGRWARYGTHNSHYHVRIYCPLDDRPRCRDTPPVWDWVSRPPVPRARRSRRSSMRRSSMRSSRRSSMRRSRRRGYASPMVP